jgi:hypothetical protein
MKLPLLKEKAIDFSEALSPAKVAFFNDLDSHLKDLSPDSEFGDRQRRRCLGWRCRLLDTWGAGDV